MKTWIRYESLKSARRLVGTNHSPTPANYLFRTSYVPVLGILALSAISALASDLSSEDHHAGKKWVASWASSMQGTLAVAPAPAYALTPASVYNTEPDLTFALPNGNTDGAVDQTVQVDRRRAPLAPRPSRRSGLDADHLVPGARWSRSRAVYNRERTGAPGQHQGLARLLRRRAPP